MRSWAGAPHSSALMVHTHCTTAHMRPECGLVGKVLTPSPAPPMTTTRVVTVSGVLALPFSCCVTLGRSLCLSGPQFPHL